MIPIIKNTSYLPPISQLNLYGYENYFSTFINLFNKKNFQMLFC